MYKFIAQSLKFGPPRCVACLHSMSDAQILSSHGDGWRLRCAQCDAELQLHVATSKFTADGIHHEMVLVTLIPPIDIHPMEDVAGGD